MPDEANPESSYEDDIEAGYKALAEDEENIEFAKAMRLRRRMSLDERINRGPSGNKG